MTTLRWGAATDPGQVRTVNQDSFLVTGTVFVVADGMGGHAAGEVASQVALEALESYSEPTVDGFIRAVRYANRAVWARGEDDDELRGMGTTLCGIALVPAEDEADGGATDDGIEPDTSGEDDGDAGDVVVVVNVGDSRVYLFQSGELVQLTDDHSLVEDLVREGRLTDEEARHHPQRNIVTRSLGNDPDVVVDSWLVTPHTGDRYLICSDGLFNEVDEDRIAGVLRRLDDPDEAASELVRLANAAGGRDNITVVLVDVVDDGGRAAAASSAVGARGGSGGRSRTLEPADDDTAGDTDGGGGDGGAEGADPGGERLAGATSATRLEDDLDSRAADTGGERPRRFTWRVAAFVMLLVLVLGAAMGSVAWYARSTYHVTIDEDDDTVVIMRGRPGGVLWLQPTLEQHTDLSVDTVPAGRRRELQEGKQQPSLAAAERFVANLREEAERFGLLDPPAEPAEEPPAEEGPADPTEEPAGEAAGAGARSTITVS